MRDFGLAFVFLLVAVDPFGLLPSFLLLTEGMTAIQRRQVVGQSVLTALCVAIGFMFIGKALFKVIGVTMSDFMIAGGVLLFVIALIDLIAGERRQRIPSEGLGAVPLGTPLIAGPAVLTAALMLRDVYGLWPTLFAIVANILLVGLVFVVSNFLLRLLGRAGAKALSKVFLVLLAAFAVMMVRRGLVAVLGGAG